jgi:hypothetical protein
MIIEALGLLRILGILVRLLVILRSRHPESALSAVTAVAPTRAAAITATIAIYL